MANEANGAVAQRYLLHVWGGVEPEVLGPYRHGGGAHGSGARPRLRRARRVPSRCLRPGRGGELRRDGDRRGLARRDGGGEELGDGGGVGLRVLDEARVRARKLAQRPVRERLRERGRVRRVHEDVLLAREDERGLLNGRQLRRRVVREERPRLARVGVSWAGCGSFAPLATACARSCASPSSADV